MRLTAPGTWPGMTPPARSLNERTRRWKAANPDTVRTARIVYRQARRETVSGWQRDYTARLKARVLERYGTGARAAAALDG